MEQTKYFYIKNGCIADETEISKAKVDKLLEKPKWEKDVADIQLDWEGETLYKQIQAKPTKIVVSPISTKFNDYLNAYKIQDNTIYIHTNVDCIQEEIIEVDDNNKCYDVISVKTIAAKIDENQWLKLA